ncbi:hypothetical protein IEO21_04881 [Rhodonia placenta]|uniref:Uncharacterized protein n=1 Tax=Rhodonia placenta TaxID=104341 RepID=A0A8H7P2X3_9APHY|nr:hypothetical protein IEO21_04881 [Postia placenta]
MAYRSANRRKWMYPCLDRPPRVLNPIPLQAERSLRTQTPDSLGDDGASVAESSRKRKTEVERIKFLQDDSLSGEVEPYRMFCNGCQTWVDLNPKRKYVMQPWLIHRKACIKQRGQSESRTDVSVQSDARIDLDVADKEPEEEDEKAKPVTPKSKIERPSNRIATAQRKLQIVNDPQAKKLKEHSVECAKCRAEVSLKGEVDYDLTLWEGHKTTCTPSTPRLPPAPSPAVSTPAPTAPVEAEAEAEAERPPPSIASTDATAIGSESSPSGRGQKRAREDEGEVIEEQSPSIRRRTEFYVAPEGDSPGFIDWLVLPFRSFPLYFCFREAWPGNCGKRSDLTRGLARPVATPDKHAPSPKRQNACRGGLHLLLLLVRLPLPFPFPHLFPPVPPPFNLKFSTPNVPQNTSPSTGNPGGAAPEAGRAKTRVPPPVPPVSPRPKSTPRSESPLLLEELTPPPPTPPSTPPPPPPSSSRVPTQRALDPAFEEYLARSQRRPTSQVSPHLFTSWQDWRWSRLRAPVWLPHETRPGSVDASGAYGLDMDEDDDMPSKFALSACRDEPYHPTAPV